MGTPIPIDVLVVGVAPHLGPRDRLALVSCSRAVRLAHHGLFPGFFAASLPQAAALARIMDLVRCVRAAPRGVSASVAIGGARVARAPSSRTAAVHVPGCDAGAARERDLVAWLRRELEERWEHVRLTASAAGSRRWRRTRFDVLAAAASAALAGRR